jgi:hypothetical protein
MEQLPTIEIWTAEILLVLYPPIIREEEIMLRFAAALANTKIYLVMRA